MKKLDFLKVSFMVRSDKKESGFSPVLMMLFLEGRRAYVSTGLVAEFKNWDSKYGRFIGDPSKVNTKNEFLERMKMDVLRIYNEMKSKEDDITVDILRLKLKGESESKAKSLIECCQIYNSSYEKLVGIEIGEITFGRYSTFASRISDFITVKLKLKDILLSDIKYSFSILKMLRIHFYGYYLIFKNITLFLSITFRKTISPLF